MRAAVNLELIEAENYIEIQILNTEMLNQELTNGLIGDKVSIQRTLSQYVNKGEPLECKVDNIETENKLRIFIEDDNLLKKSYEFFKNFFFGDFFKDMIEAMKGAFGGLYGGNPF
ncbi:MAG: hypothetical protein GF317_22235 [Candidatus Lokiarchaeota archaeon]|nr:hypothetical protein [Candidatus Lokiarchaeota archaeon]MBD3202180.1 hypothetical protein [Candidatus Lokiarchaeota archaeon]